MVIFLEHFLEFLIGNFVANGDDCDDEGRPREGVAVDTVPGVGGLLRGRQGPVQTEGDEKEHRDGGDVARVPVVRVEFFWGVWWLD